MKQGKIIRLEARALSHLEESLSSRFEEAVRMLQACQGKVILMGVGKSGLIAFLTVERHYEDKLTNRVGRADVIAFCQLDNTLAS